MSKLNLVLWGGYHRGSLISVQIKVDDDGYIVMSEATAKRIYRHFSCQNTLRQTRKVGCCCFTSVCFSVSIEPLTPEGYNYRVPLDDFAPVLRDAVLAKLGCDMDNPALLSAEGGV